MRKPQEILRKSPRKGGGWCCFVLLFFYFLLSAPVFVFAVLPTSFENVLSLRQKENNLPPELETALDDFSKGNPSQAFRKAQSFLKKNPNSVAALEIYGTAALSLGKYKEAEDSFNKVLDFEPGRISPKLALGRIFLEKRDYENAEFVFQELLSSRPNLLETRFYLAVSFLGERRLEKARLEAKRVANLSHGNHPEAEYLAAYVLHEMGRFEEVEEALHALLRKNPDWEKALLLEGILKLEQDQTEAAAEIFEKLKRLHSNSPWLALGRSVLKRIDGKFLEAEKDQEALLKKYPRWVLPYFQLTETFLSEGQTMRAAKILSEASRSSSDPARVREKAAYLFLKYQQPDPALDFAHQLLASPESAYWARTIVVQAYLLKGNSELAEYALKSAFWAQPKDFALLMDLGNFYLDRGQPKESIPYFSKAAALSPRALPAVRGLALAYVSSGQNKNAEREIEKFTGLENSAENFSFAGRIYEMLKQPAKAMEKYRQALALDPYSIPAACGVAEQWSDSWQVRKAVSLLEKVAQMHPDSAQPLLELARVQELAGLRREAEAVYQEALRRRPFSSAVLNNFAFFLTGESKRLNEARRLAEKARRINPEDPQICDTLSWIEDLAGDYSKAAFWIQKSIQIRAGDAEILQHFKKIQEKYLPLQQGRELDGLDKPPVSEIVPLPSKK